MKVKMAKYPIVIKDFRKEDTKEQIKAGCDKMIAICGKRLKTNDHFVKMWGFVIVINIVGIIQIVGKAILGTALGWMDGLFLISYIFFLVNALVESANHRWTKKEINEIWKTFEAMKDDPKKLEDLDPEKVVLLCCENGDEAETLLNLVEKISVEDVIRATGEQIVSLMYNKTIESATFICIDPKKDVFDKYTCCAVLSREDREDIQLSIVDFKPILRIPNDVTDEDIDEDMEFYGLSVSPENDEEYNLLNAKTSDPERDVMNEKAKALILEAVRKELFYDNQDI